MKTTEEIYEDMRAAYAEKTGLAVGDGGDMALRLYAVASQLYCLWVQTDYLTRQTFPQTAEGEYLDRHAALRGLTRGEAAKAAGTLRFCLKEAAAAAVTVPAATACMTAASVEFVTTADIAIPAGALYADAAASAVTTGSAGNVPAESVLYMERAPSGVAEVYNPAAFSGGADAEEDGALRARVLASYRKLPNGTNAAYYEARALNTDGVAAVSVLPKRRGLGTVDVIVADAAGPAGPALLAAVQEKLRSEREICVDIQVLAPAVQAVAVSAAVTAESGADPAAVKSAVEAVLTDYFTGRLLGQDVLRARLGSLIFAVEGVKNYALAAPAADVAVAADSLPMLSSLTVTVTEA